MNVIEQVERYTAYLIENGVNFKNDGFPIFKKEWFIKTKPSIISPFNKRAYYSHDPKDISICFFMKDECLYPRFDNIFKEIKVFKNYHSICMMDLSISPLMLNEVQRMNLLLNLLYICVVAVNGIKIIPSYRTADFETIKLLSESIGYSKYWVMGAVGTQRITKNSFFEYLFKVKCLLIDPDILLIYGKPNKTTISTLNLYGIDFNNSYKDFRSLSYHKEIDDA